MKKKRTARPAIPSGPPFTTLVMDGVMRVAGSFAFWRFSLWVVLLVAMFYGLAALDKHAEASDKTVARIEWVGLPEWLRSEPWSTVLTQMQEIVHNGERQPLVYNNTNLRSPAVCPWVHHFIAASPWVERLDRVSKLSDGRIQVRAFFRRPFATIQRDGRCYLVDQRGIRLPVDWAADTPYQEDWLRISGAKAPPPGVGQIWNGLDVQAGLLLAAFFEAADASGKLPFRKELRSIDVADYNETLGGLRIITRNQRSYIRWGHVPGKGYGVEASAELKLAALNTMYEQWGEFPDRGPVSIRFAPSSSFETSWPEPERPQGRP